MDRRKFIQRGCSTCVGLTGLGFLLQSCGTALPVLKSVAENKTFVVPVSKFEELKTSLLLIRNSQLENDILLVKKDNAYKALFMKCTHEGVGLTATASKIVCSAHGSVFDFDGQVVKEPALRPLREFKTDITDNNIIIHLT